jgi:hypothetical protein
MADPGQRKGQEKETILRDKLEEIEQQRTYAKDQLDRERVMRVTNEVIETITSPGFVEKMRLARVSADDGGGLDEAAKLLSIDGLRDAGVDIPKDFRLTSRVFEDRTAGFKLELNSELSNVLGGRARVSWGGCAGAGGLSFCGCGGFST